MTAKLADTKTGSSQFFRGALMTLTVFASAALQTSEASAVSARVKLACASDYYAYCSMHPVGTPAVRQCMRSAGPKLSKRCVNALISEGEVSQTEVARRAASIR